MFGGKLLFSAGALTKSFLLRNKRPILTSGILLTYLNSFSIHIFFIFHSQPVFTGRGHPSSYGEDSPNLVWISKEGRISDPTEENLENAVPCFLNHVPASKTWVLYSHPTSHDNGQMEPQLKRISEEIQVNVLSYEYPGYGIFKGLPTREGIHEVHQTIYEYLTKHANVPPKNIFIYGQEIGTGIACDLASEIEREQPNALAGVILQNPFLSINEMTSPSIISWFLPNSYNNMKALESVKCPVFYISGADARIPQTQCMQLYNQTPGKTYYIVQEDQKEEEVLQALKSFIQQHRTDKKADRQTPVIWLS